MSSEALTLLAGMVAIALLMAAPAAALVWVTRTRLQVTVYDAARRPVAGAVVVGHLTQRHGGYVGANNHVIESSSSEVTRTLGCTGPDGVLRTWLLLSNPWALHAEGPDGRSANRLLPAREPGEAITAELHLRGPNSG
jgi:hypothetical protein